MTIKSIRAVTLIVLAACATCLLVVGAAQRRTSLNAELIDAVMWGDHVRVERLLGQGADPNCWAKSDLQQSGFTRFLESLCGRKRDQRYKIWSDVPVLSLAARNPNPRTAQLLLDAGADCNMRDLAGNTPLIYAAPFARDTAELLIRSGADVNARGYNGATALLRAVERNWDLHPGPDPAMIELLLAHGADPNLQDGNGHWPAGQAAAHGHTKVAGLLNNAAATRRARDTP
jgi:uncharacterized protein